MGKIIEKNQAGFSYKEKEFCVKLNISQEYINKPNISSPPVDGDLGHWVIQT